MVVRAEAHAPPSLRLGSPAPHRSVTRETRLRLHCGTILGALSARSASDAERKRRAPHSGRHRARGCLPVDRAKPTRPPSCGRRSDHPARRRLDLFMFMVALGWIALPDEPHGADRCRDRCACRHYRCKTAGRKMRPRRVPGNLGSDPPREPAGTVTVTRTDGEQRRKWTIGQEPSGHNIAQRPQRGKRWAMPKRRAVLSPAAPSSPPAAAARRRGRQGP